MNSPYQRTPHRSFSEKAHQDRQITSYIVLGGGTAGWISAAMLARATQNLNCTITVVESPHIPTVGVGEATIPSIMDMLEYLQIPARDFIRRTNSTFKLAIKFVDWFQKGQHYWHPFGKIGNDVDGQPFYQHWLKHKLRGGSKEFTDFSPSIAMSKLNKFHIPDPKQRTNMSASSYALHFDAGLVAEYLANYCVKRGVQHIKAEIEHVQSHPNNEIKALVAKDGQIINGGFFIDCSGQRGLLIEKTLGVELDNWQQFLPVDRAVVAQTEKVEPLPPYTESIAHEHGWRWKIPLQNRTGNGYVYCSKFCTDEEAQATLSASLVGKQLTEFRTLKFTTGKRQRMWEKNCLAVGLSSGFLEPLESTSIYLIMKSMLNFVQSLPDKNLQPFSIIEFNRLMDIEYECIRDFIVLHYCATARDDSAFWKMWQQNPIPSSLQNKIQLFQEHGRLFQNKLDLFSQDSWYAVLEGMNVRPMQYDPSVDASKFEQIEHALPSAAAALTDSAKRMLSHDDFIKQLLARA